MLRALQIENYALIRRLQISFCDGFTVITGETGAGKSILMGALSLILGSRADTGVLHDLSAKCVVEGTFDISALKLQPFFEEHDLDYQDETVIRREITEQGKSRAFVNDTPVNLSALKSLASFLVDIHSQHESLLLQEAGFRMRLIDQYARNGEPLSAYRRCLKDYRDAERACRQLEEQCDYERKQQDYNEFAAKEIEEAQLSPTDQEDVEKSVRLLSRAEEVKSALFEAAQRLSEREDGNVLQELRAVLDSCRRMDDLDAEYAAISRRIEAVEVELKDLAYEIVRKEAAVEVNPEELERQTGRLSLLYTLQQKYAVGSVAELIALQARLRASADGFRDRQEQLGQLLRARAESGRLLREAARALTRSREAVLPDMQQDITRRLRRLNMPDARFEIQLLPAGDCRTDGTDVARFSFSANKGVEPADLSKVASGGEMSRLMLALKSVITDSMLLPTVVFDEIDTGISGETANRVADTMLELSKHHQLIVITHLPQIAVRATAHYIVYKDRSGTADATCIRPLSEEEREEAVAVMIGGSRVSAPAREAARLTAHEMLNQNKT